jgi:vitamin B12 transporter
MRAYAFGTTKTTALIVGLLSVTFNASAQTPDTEQSEANTTTVTIRGRQTLQQRFMSPSSMVVIDRQDIETMGANTIGDILRQTPGVQATVTPNGGLEIRTCGTRE